MFGLSLTVPFLYEWWRYKGMVLGMTRFDCRMPCILLRNYVFLWGWGDVWDCRPKPRLGISSPNPIFASRRLKAAFVESGTLRSLILAFMRFAIWGMGGTFGALPQAPLRGFSPQTPIFASRRLKAAFVESGTLRSLILAFMCFAILGTGVTLGCRPNPPEGDSPSDSLLRFAAV